jgi:hypothetical protein
MNPGRILTVFAEHGVDCLLIGGMNFFLRHQPVTTFDVDFWIADETANLRRTTEALADLAAECEHPDGSWGPVPREETWLQRKAVHCLTSPAGAIDLFRFVAGLASYEECKARAVAGRTSAGASYLSLSDRDMLECQLALPEGSRRLDRMAYLRKIVDA